MSDRAMNPSVPLEPPREWFTPPVDMPKDAGCIVDSQGRVYGYLCHWGSILMDGTNDRWKAPRSKNGYAFAHTGDTLLDDGQILKTANLGGDMGHAPTGTGDLSSTQDFYENTQTQLARIRYGEDEHGVWFAGACWPSVTEFDIAKLRASARSGHWAAVGDWRDIQSGRSGYELVGACLVNVPGLKYARADRAASGVLSFNPMSIGANVQKPEGVISIERVASSGSAVLLATDDAVVEVAPDVAVGGVLLVEGVPTEDGRLIESGAAEWRELPLPLYSSLLNLPGHDSAALVGRIDNIFRDADNPAIVMWEGSLVPGLADGGGQATIDAINAKALQGISIDGIVGPNDAYWDEDDVNVMSRIVVAGATLTPMPAIQDATVTLLSSQRLDCGMPDENVLLDDEVDVVIAEGTTDDDRLSALHDKVDALADRVEFLISIVESWQMSARYEAAAAKAKS